MLTKVIYSIYMATSQTSGKSYIGFTGRNIDTRKQEHIRKSKTSSNYHFHNAIRKYGIDDFTWTLLWQSPSKETSLLAEDYYINVYNTLDDGYNMTCGGGTFPSWQGKQHSQETKDKIGKAHKGKVYSQETRNKISKARIGTNHSKKSKDKMSKTWKIIFPNGHVEIIKNLFQFCKDNNISHVCMANIAQGKQKQHKGFKCEYA